MKAREGLLCFVPHEHACGGGCVYPHSHLGTVASLCIALHAFCIFALMHVVPTIALNVGGGKPPPKGLTFLSCSKKVLARTK